jgi:hypothetical protein
MKPTVMIEDQENWRLVELVRKVDSYLLGQQIKDLFETSAESSEKVRELKPFIQKKLGSGIRLHAQLGSDKQTTILRIFLDPIRFNAWTDALGSLEFLYMDPYGVEVCFKADSWQISVDKMVVKLQNTDEIYEIARIEVQRIGDARKLVRIL